MSSKLINRVRSLLERGERISVEDGAELFGVKDLLALGKLARIPRDRRFGSGAFLRRVYSVTWNGGDVGSFVAAVLAEAPEGTEEIALRVTDSNSDSLVNWSERLREFSHASIPVAVQVSAGFVARLAAAEGIGAIEVLKTLRSAGTIALNGLEAEIFDPSIRSEIMRPVIGGDEWLAIHEAAHTLGMKTHASMVYLVEDHPAEYAAHIEAIRQLQDRTGGFVSFAPLAVHYQGVKNHLAMPTAAQSLRTIAISRIMLDNIPHIASVPSLVTAEVAVVALGYGADSVETTIVSGDILLGEMPPAGGSELQVLDGDAANSGMDFRRIEQRMIEGRYVVQPVDAGFEAARVG